MHTRHRPLKSRTAVSHDRVRELGSIQLLKVTYANVARFLRNFVHLMSMWNIDSEFGNDMFYIFDFIKHNTSLSSDSTCISGTGFSHRTTALCTKCIVHNFRMDINNLFNFLTLTRNTLHLSSSLPPSLHLSSSIPTPSSLFLCLLPSAVDMK